MNEEIMHENTNNKRIITILLALICAILIVGVLIYGYGLLSQRVENNGQITSITENLYNGDYESAVRDFNAIMNNANSSDIERAQAVYDVVGSRYKLSGNTEDFLLDIRDMKKIIDNSAVDSVLRANLLTELAMRYHALAKNPAVFSEIFEKNDSLSQYSVAGDPDRSVANLVEYSYELAPTAYSSIYLANWYSWNAFSNPEFITNADTYLKEAERLAELELVTNFDFRLSPQYATYLLMHASTVYRLAVLSDMDEYSEENARQEFNDLFAFLMVEGSASVKEQILTYARLFYATYIAADEEDLKTQLDKLAQELKALPNTETNSTVLFLRKELADPNSFWKRDIDQIKSYSPEFEQALADLNI